MTTESTTSAPTSDVEPTHLQKRLEYALAQDFPHGELIIELGHLEEQIVSLQMATAGLMQFLRPMMDPGVHPHMLRDRVAVDMEGTRSPLGQQLRLASRDLGELAEVLNLMVESL